MEKEFIPYELALKLKELGFNEECFGWWSWINGNQAIYYGYSCNNTELSFRNNCTAPLWQQAFEFFREKYDLNSYIQHEGIYGYYYVINYEKYGNGDENCGFHYEEARLKCLTKLIEIAK